MAALTRTHDGLTGHSLADENLSDDEDDGDAKPKPARRASVAKRRSSVTADAEPKTRPVAARRSTRRSTGAAGAQLPALTDLDDQEMVEEGGTSTAVDDAAMVVE
jgi:hypothetical protein